MHEQLGLSIMGLRSSREIENFRKRSCDILMHSILDAELGLHDGLAFKKKELRERKWMRRPWRSYGPLAHCASRRSGCVKKSGCDVGSEVEKRDLHCVEILVETGRDHVFVGALRQGFQRFERVARKRDAT